jgi:hypothetical protein
MEITRTETEASVPVTVFHIEGAFNADEPLAGMIRQAVEDGTRNILLDLSDVPYMSSAGLRALHTGYTLLRDKSETSDKVNKGLREGSYYSPHLKLLKPSKMVMEVLSISGYDMFLESFTDQKKALAAFS